MILCVACGVALGAGTCGACAASGPNRCSACGMTIGKGKCLYCAMARMVGALPSTTLPPIGGRPIREVPRELPRELAAEPIVAWRCWLVVSGMLVPMAQGNKRTWATRDATARCDRCTYLLGTPPGLNCSCGLYASKEAVPVAGSGSGSGVVWGKVALYGKVIEHERGYRAQHARILELHTDDPMLALLLRLTYGVPVTASPPAPPGGVVPPAFQRQVIQRALGGGPFDTTPPKRRGSRADLFGALICAAIAISFASIGFVSVGTGSSIFYVSTALVDAFAAGFYATHYLRPRP